MSQDIFDNIVPSTTSGSQLATLLNSFKDAYASGNSGTTSRPANIQAYGAWVRTDYPSASIFTMYIYDGTQDIEIFQVNETTASIILTNSEDSFNIIKNSDDALGPELGLKKGRIAGGGQTELNDILGNIKWTGRDASAVEYEQARIGVTALEDVTSGAHGSEVAFYVTQTGTSSLVKAVTISNDKKLGVGVTAPTQMIENESSDSTAGYKATNVADSAVGASVILKKKRVASSGQVLSSDVIGNFKSISTDDGGLEIDAANIKAVAEENHTSTAGGTTIIIQRVKIGETALSDAITIDNDGVTIADNLVVSGITTSVNTTNTEIADKNITINDGGDDASSEGAGITVERTGTDGSIVYEDALTSKFKIGALASEVEVVDVSSDQTLTTKTLTGNKMANLSPDGVETITFPVATDTVATLTGAESLTNKSIEGPSRLDVKIDTEANLATYASTASNGQLCFASDSKKMYQVKDSALAEVGGGGAGDANTVHLIRAADLQLADIDLTGSDAEFDGGGTITASSVTLSSTAADLILEDQVIKYDPDANGANDYFGFTKAIPTGLRGREMAFQFEYKNESTTLDDDFRFCVKIKDGANADDITYENMEAYEGADNTSQKFSTLVFIPSDCTEIEFGWQNTDSTTTVELMVDNILVSSSAFVYKNLIEYQEIRYDQDASDMVDTSGELRFNLSNITSSGANFLTTSDDATRTLWTANRDCVVHARISGLTSNNAGVYFLKNGTRVAIGSGSTVTNNQVQTNITLLLEKDDYISWETSADFATGDPDVQMFIVAQAEAEAVIHSGEVELEEITLGDANGFGSTDNKIRKFDTVVKNTSDKLLSLTNLSANGTYFTALQPCMVTVSFNDRLSSGITQLGISLNSSELTTAIAAITKADRMAQETTSGSSRDGSCSWSGILATGDAVRPHCGGDANGTTASHLSITAIPLARTVITPLTRTVYLKDSKASTTVGGAATTGSYQTSVINTLEGDTSFVTLSSNQVTLGAGTYLVDIEVPFYQTDDSKAKLYDVTGAADQIIGSVVTSTAADGVVVKSRIVSQMTITTLTDFEVRYRVDTNTSTSDLGKPAGFGDVEIYLNGSITKIK